MEPSPLECIEELLIEGLLECGEHHKQWYLEEALKQVRGLIGRPFPDDLGAVHLNLGELEQGQHDGRWVSLPAYHLYDAGIAP
jgi:hypothetical protein